MAGQSILEIILTAKDQASEKIKQVGDAVENAQKKTQDMSAAFKAAGGILVGVGLAGVGVMSQLVEAAAKHQQVMASVDATLKNVAQSQGTYTEVVSSGTSATTSSKKAIQEQIQALQLQKQQLTLTNAETTQSVTVTTGHGKTLKEHTKIVHQDAAEITAQKNAIDQQIISLKEQELGIGKSGNTQAAVTKIVSNASMSYQSLVKTTDDVTQSYLNLGFAENDTAPAFAQDLRITGNITDAKTMLAAAADYARLKNIDLATATSQLSMAYAGQGRALKALGIELPKGAKGMEAISAVSKAAAGQADAFAHTYDGAMQVLGASFDSLKEKLGARLLPSVTQFTLSISSLIDKLNNLSPATYDTIVNVLKFGTAFALIAGPILLIIGFLPSLVAGFTIFSGVALPVIGILAGVALGAYLLYTHWGQVIQIFNASKPYIDDVVKALSQFWTEVQPRLAAVWDKVKTDFQTIQDFIKQHWDQIKAIFEVALAAIGIVLVTQWEIFKTQIKVALDIMAGNWKAVWGDIKDFTNNTWKDINTLTGGGLDKMVTTVKTKYDEAKRTVTGWYTDLVNGINNFQKNWLSILITFLENLDNTMYQYLNDTLKKWTDGFVNMGVQAGNALNNFVTQTIPQWFSNLSNAFVRGFDNILKEVGDWFTNLGKNTQPQTDTAAHTMIKNVSQGIDNHKQELFMKLADLIAEALILIIPLIVVGFIDVGSKIINSINTGITNESAQLIKGIETLASDMVSAFEKNFKTPHFSIGTGDTKILGQDIKYPTLDVKWYEQGGYVPNTGLAMLHAGEFVLSKNMLNGSSPTPQQVSNVTNKNTPINVYATINTDMDLNLLGNKLAFAVRNTR